MSRTLRIGVIAPVTEREIEPCIDSDGVQSRVTSRILKRVVVSRSFQWRARSCAEIELSLLEGALNRHNEACLSASLS